MSELPSNEQLAQYTAFNTTTGICQLARTQVELTGADRIGFLQAFCTGDIKRLQPGEGCEAFITNHQGKAAGHVLVFCEAERLLLDGAPGQAEKLIAHLDRFVISERVEFRDLSSVDSELFLAGHTSPQVLSSLGCKVPASRLQHTSGNIAGTDVLLRCVDFLSVPGFLISCQVSSLDSVSAAVIAAGAVPCSEQAFAMARLEAGYPLYGFDISEENLPQEVQRNAQAISFTKGCYLGQETIARLDALGHVNRVLTGLKLPANHGLVPGATIMQGDKKLAQLTSIAYSPKLQAEVALAYVRTLQAVPGRQLAFPGGEVEVIALPINS